MKRLMILAGLLLIGAAPAPEMKLWRLDCGELDISDFGMFSDAHRYDGKPHRAVDSCYLVKHGTDYLLWDTGIAGPVKQGPFTMALKERIAPQLARIGVTPEQVTMVGISHYHDDHIGQLADFPKSKLLIGAGDWAAIKAAPERFDAKTFAPWMTGGTPVEPVARDKDVFGDGSVTMLNLPGHTPGHHGLLVRLPKIGAVLLTGDLYHATESMAVDEVPSFNTDRADTLASFDRFKRIAKNLKALVVIQHEPADVAKLPAFPKAAD